MSATVETARYNLRTVAANVAARLEVDPRVMTYDRRREYNRALAAEILKYPLAFTPEILAIAGNIRDQGALTAETSWGDFASEVVNEAATLSVPVLGNFTNKLLWIIALGVVVWIFANRRTPPPATARA